MVLGIHLPPSDQRQDQSSQVCIRWSGVKAPRVLTCATVATVVIAWLLKLQLLVGRLEDALSLSEDVFVLFENVNLLVEARPEELHVGVLLINS